eukprot:scaffold182547_cov23-Tisochrysis_lutea.AAC.1
MGVWRVSVNRGLLSPLFISSSTRCELRVLLPPRRECAVMRMFSEGYDEEALWRHVNHLCLPKPTRFAHFLIESLRSTRFLFISPSLLPSSRSGPLLALLYLSYLSEISLSSSSSSIFISRLFLSLSSPIVL